MIFVLEFNRVVRCSWVLFVNNCVDLSLIRLVSKLNLCVFGKIWERVLDVVIYFSVGMVWLDLSNLRSLFCICLLDNWWSFLILDV